jgi:hypothetical protein
MDSPTSIQEFHELLHSEDDRTELVSALMALTEVEDIDTIVNAVGPMGNWAGWN